MKSETKEVKFRGSRVEQGHNSKQVARNMGCMRTGRAKGIHGNCAVSYNDKAAGFFFIETEGAVYFAPSQNEIKQRGHW